MGEDVCPLFRAANRAAKNKNREGDGALQFDDSCWMKGRNNQRKVSLIVGLYLGEKVRRAAAIGEEAVESFLPSDSGQKVEYNEICRGFRRSPIFNCHATTNLMNAEVMGKGLKRMYDCRGTQGGLYLIVMGASIKLGGVIKIYKIDALNKLIIFLASLSI